MDFGVILCIFLLVLVSSVAPAAKNCAKEPKCSIGRTRDFRSADCYNRDLAVVPKCIPYDSEVIELTHNRIRKISRTDLTSYSYVKYLYLDGNRINTIDPEAFAELTSLETLDLSDNTLNDLPPAIFHLPSLKVLYLRQNWNINIADAVDKAKPISSPLTKLDISVITDEQTVEFPDFGELPLLVFFNISYNRFKTLTPKYFSGLCNLKILINDNMTVDEYDDPCDCWRINTWLGERDVRYNLTLPCEVGKKACKNNLTISNEDMEIYNQCRGNLQQIEQIELWIKIGKWVGGVVGVIVLVAAIVFMYIKCNKPTKKTTKSAKKATADAYAWKKPRISEPELQLLGLGRGHSRI